MFAVCKLLDHNSRSVHIMWSILYVVYTVVQLPPIISVSLISVPIFCIWLPIRLCLPIYVCTCLVSSPGPGPISLTHMLVFLLWKCVYPVILCREQCTVRQCTRIEKNLGTLQWIFIEIYILNFLYNSVQQNIYGVHFFVMCKQICSCLSFP